MIPDSNVVGVRRTSESTECPGDLIRDCRGLERDKCNAGDAGVDFLVAAQPLAFEGYRRKS